MNFCNINNLLKNTNSINEHGRFISNKKNNTGENPLVTYLINDKTFELKFIRTKKEIKLIQLINCIKNFARKRGCIRIILEDDALFISHNNSTCKYNALIYRAFQNKKSIYYDNGFIPYNPNLNSTNCLRNLEYHLNIIYNFEIRDFLNMKQYIKNNDGTEIVINNINSINKNKKFGEWLINKECNIFSIIITKILTLAYNRLKNEYRFMNENTKKFLESIEEYRILHKNLVFIL